MNYYVTVPDTGNLFDFFDLFMRQRENRPTLDDVLGAACELYRVNPDDIKEPDALPAARAYCYVAGAWSREPFVTIGGRVGLDSGQAIRASRFVAFSAWRDATVRDDLDLLALRVAERVLIRKRLAKCQSR